MIPFLFVGALVGIVVLTKVSSHKLDEKEIARKQAMYQRHELAQGASSAGLSALQVLHMQAASRMAISPAIVEAALREAWNMGDMRLVHEIAIAFQKQMASLNAPPTPPAAPATVGAAASPAPTPPPALEVKSPLKGVSDDDWSDFVTALKEHDEDFATDKHLGAFHHSRSRLNQLGIKDAPTYADQYRALVADIIDIRNQQNGALKHLLDTYGGNPITVDGQDYVVTASGVLALLKNAGTKNAKRWLEESDPSARSQHTTAVFLRANGIF